MRALDSGVRNRVARYCTPCVLLPIALVLLLADLTITVALVGLAYEVNPVALWLSTTVGWTGAGVLAVGSVALAFIVAERAPACLGRAAAVVVTLVMAVPVAWNLYVFVQLGIPELLWLDAVETIAPAAVVAGVVVLRQELAKASRLAAGPFSSRRARSVALVFIMVIWLPAVGFTGGITTDSLHHGMASAEPDSDEAQTVIIQYDENVTKYNPVTEEIIWNDDFGERPDHIEISDDGQYAAVGGADGKLKLYETDTGNVDFEVSDPGDNEDLVNDIEWISGDKIFVSYNNVESDVGGVLYDMDGEVVWKVEFENSDNRGGGVAESNSGRIYIADSRGTVNNGDGRIFEVDRETGEKINQSISTGNGWSSLEADERLYADDGSIDKFDQDLDFIEEVDDFSQSVEVLSTGREGIKEVLGSDGAEYRYKQIDGEWEVKAPDQTGDYVAADVENLQIYAIDDDDTLNQYDWDGDLQNQYDIEQFNEPFYIEPVSGIGAAETTTGQVTDQSGSAVPNATVEMWTASTDLPNPEQQLIDLSSPEPDDFDADLSITDGSNALINDVDDELPLVYGADAFNDINVIGLDDADLQDAQVANIPAGEPIRFVAWDPTDEPGFLASTDEYNRQLPGQKSSGTIEIERLSASGETESRQTIETDQTQGGGLIDPTTLDYAETTLPAGFYRISVEDADAEYLIQVGDRTQLVESLRDDVVDVTGEPTARAQEVTDALDGDDFGRERTTSNEDGEFELDADSNAATVAITAYRAGGLEDDLDENLSLTDLEQAANDTQYDGRFAVSTSPTFAEPGDEDVTVETLQIDTLPFQDFEDFFRAEELWDEFIGNFSSDELPSMVAEELDGLDRDELEGLHEELSNAVEENERLEQRLEDRLDDSPNLDDRDDLGDDELAEQIDALQSAIEGLQSDVDVDDEIDIGEETISYQVTLDERLSGVDRDDITVLATYSDGTTEPVPDDNVSISRSGTAQHVIEIEDFAVDEDVSGVTFDVVADVDGGLATASGHASNPLFDGESVDIESIAVSELTPSTGETVTLTVNPEDEFAFEGIDDASVQAENGDRNATVDDDSIEFSAGQGEHAIRLEFATGETEVVRLQSLDESRGHGHAIRAVDGTTGRWALVSGFEAGSIDTQQEGQSLVMTGEIGDSQSPPRDVEVYADSLLNGPEQQLTVRMTESGTQAMVNQRFRATVHLGDINEEAGFVGSGATVTRTTGADGSTPITRQETGAGQVHDKNGSGTRVETISSEDGEVTVEVDNDAGFVDRAAWNAQQLVPDWVPLLSSAPIVMPDDVVPVVDPLPIDLPAVQTEVIP